MKKLLIGAAVLVVLLLLLFPMILTGGLMSALVAFLNPAFAENEPNDVHWQSIQEVNAQYHPENELEVYLVKSVDLFYHDKIMEDKREIVEFIEQYYLLRKEREIQVTEIVDGKEVTHTEIEVYYEYKTFYEVISMIRAAPFSFEDGVVAAVIHLSMTGFRPDQGWTEGTPVDPGEHTEGTLNGRYPAPVKNGVITCGYEDRVDPISGKHEFHPALDIQGEWHAPITALAEGEVSSISTTVSPYGNFIIVKHTPPEGTFYAKYAHLSQILVKVGDHVDQGQQIGVEGGDPKRDPNPGWTTGHHVHLEMWTAEGRLNPADYIY